MSKNVTCEKKAADTLEDIITTNLYEGKYFWVEVTVDAVQTHNAAEAVRSAWGIDPSILGISG